MEILCDKSGKFSSVVKKFFFFFSFRTNRTRYCSLSLPRFLFNVYYQISPFIPVSNAHAVAHVEWPSYKKEEGSKQRPDEIACLIGYRISRRWKRIITYEPLADYVLTYPLIGYLKATEHFSYLSELLFAHRYDFIQFWK